MEIWTKLAAPLGRVLIGVRRDAPRRKILKTRLSLLALLACGLSACPFGKKKATEVKVSEVDQTIAFESLTVLIDLEHNKDYKNVKLSPKNTSFVFENGKDKSDDSGINFAITCTLNVQIEQKSGDLIINDNSVNFYKELEKEYPDMAKPGSHYMKSNLLKLSSGKAEEATEFYLKDLMGAYTAELYTEPGSKEKEPMVLFVNANGYAFGGTMDKSIVDKAKPVVIEIKNELGSESQNNVACIGIHDKKIVITPKAKT